MGVALPLLLLLLAGVVDGLLLPTRPGKLLLLLLLAGAGLFTGVAGSKLDGVLFLGVVLPGLLLLFTGAGVGLFPVAGVDGLVTRPGTFGWLLFTGAGLFPTG